MGVPFDDMCSDLIEQREDGTRFCPGCKRVLHEERDGDEYYDHADECDPLARMAAEVMKEQNDHHLIPDYYL